MKSSFSLSSCLKHVRKDPLIFNQQVFGDILRRKRKVENRLKGVQHRIEKDSH